MNKLFLPVTKSTRKFSSDANATHFLLSLQKFEPDIDKICIYVNEAITFQ
jgi:hypothetical protein